MNINKHLYNKHCNCAVKIAYDYNPKKSRSNNSLTRPALMCVQHNRWLKWLSQKEATALVEQGLVE